MKSSKGSAFERRICKQLSEWWTDGESDAVFWRTPMSGGRATVRGKTGKASVNQHGDLCATDPIGKPLTDLLTFELKRGYSRFSPFDAIDRSGGKMSMTEDWVCQAQAAARLSKSRSWAIIFQRDRRRAMIMMPTVTKGELAEASHLDEEGLHCAYPMVRLCFPTQGPDHVGIDNDSVDVHTLDHFLSATSRRTVETVLAWKKKRKS